MWRALGREEKGSEKSVPLVNEVDEDGRMSPMSQKRGIWFLLLLSSPLLLSCPQEVDRLLAWYRCELQQECLRENILLVAPLVEIIFTLMTQECIHFLCSCLDILRNIRGEETRLSIEREPLSICYWSDLLYMHTATRSQVSNSPSCGVECNMLWLLFAFQEQGNCTNNCTNKHVATVAHINILAHSNPPLYALSAVCCLHCKNKAGELE